MQTSSRVPVAMRSPSQERSAIGLTPLVISRRVPAGVEPSLGDAVGDGGSNT